MDKKEIFQTYFEELTSDVLYSEDIESYFYQYKKFTLKIVIPNSFPKSLPEFYLSNYSDFNKWYSHVGSEGKLCYISENNLIWDIKDIKDKDKLKKLEEIEIKNDARMGRKNQTSK